MTISRGGQTILSLKVRVPRCIMNMSASGTSMIVLLSSCSGFGIQGVGFEVSGFRFLYQDRGF